MSYDIDQAARRVFRECIRAYLCKDVKNDYPDWDLSSAAHYILDKAGLNISEIPSEEELSDE